MTEEMLIIMKVVGIGYSFGFFLGLVFQALMFGVNGLISLFNTITME